MFSSKVIVFSLVGCLSNFGVLRSMAKPVSEPFLTMCDTLQSHMVRATRMTLRTHCRKCPTLS